MLQALSQPGLISFLFPLHPHCTYSIVLAFLFAFPSPSISLPSVYEQWGVREPYLLSVFCVSVWQVIRGRFVVFDVSLSARERDRLDREGAGGEQSPLGCQSLCPRWRLLKFRLLNSRGKGEKNSLGMFLAVWKWANISLNRCVMMITGTVCLLVCLETG